MNPVFAISGLSLSTTLTFINLFSYLDCHYRDFSTYCLSGISSWEILYQLFHTGTAMLLIAIFSIIAGLSAASKCPSSPPLTQAIDTDLIKGRWMLAANNPEFDEKCKNLTFSDGRRGKIQLREDLFMSTENWALETNEYDITTEQNAPYMILENKSSHSKLKLFLVAGDYCCYLIVYSCDDSSGTSSEAWEIWTRRNTYTATSLPRQITTTLSKVNLKPNDFSYRTASDCIH